MRFWLRLLGAREVSSAASRLSPLFGGNLKGIVPTLLQNPVKGKLNYIAWAWYFREIKSATNVRRWQPPASHTPQTALWPCTPRARPRSFELLCNSERP